MSKRFAVSAIAWVALTLGGSTDVAAAPAVGDDGLMVGRPPLIADEGMREDDDAGPEIEEFEDTVAGAAPYDVAQFPGPPGTRPPPARGGYAPSPGYGPPGYRPPGAGFGVQRRRPVSSRLEIGFLYVTAAAHGIGTGLWVNTEAEVRDPGTYVIAPAAFGAAMPLTVFIVDRFAFRRGMPEGLPSAIASGAVIGSAAGLGVSLFELTTSGEGEGWGKVGVARAQFFGSTLGAGAGAGLYYLLKPRPQHNMLLMSSVVWGAGIGAAFGGGATSSSNNWDATDNYVALGANIGMGVALAGAVTATAFWTPSWSALGWMHAGFGLGTVASLPIYFAYISDDTNIRRGLIAQGIGAMAGVGLAAALAPRFRFPGYAQNDEESGDPAWVQIKGVSMMPVERGLGASMSGLLW